MGDEAAVTKPISPYDIPEKPIPGGVFEAFNELIIREFDGNRAVVWQKEAAKLASEKTGFSIDALYSKKFMDVELSYTKAGWEVVYDKPGYNESYPPSYTFRKPKAGRA